jgi:UDP-2,4-diacetamido-2,4,6-trideoxy-beta-L-altropyranose hydrolase
MSAARRILIRTDVGAGIGLGHLRRCLALARALRSIGTEARFLVNGGDGAVPDMEFEVDRVAAAHDPRETVARARHDRALAVVVDSYFVDTPYLQALVDGGCRVVAIDDPGDRELPVDLVVNPSAAAGRPSYRGAAHTRYLLGPRYAMLQPEFAGPLERHATDRVRRVLLTIGGGDSNGLIDRLTRTVLTVIDGITLDVVIGPWFGDANRLRALAAASTGAIVVRERPRDMHALMLGADVAVSGGGQTTFELAATGTPTIAIRLADNQTSTLRTLTEAGALVPAGDADDPSLGVTLTSALDTLIKDDARRAEMSRRARAAVDGRGAARRP